METTLPFSSLQFSVNKRKFHESSNLFPRYVTLWFCFFHGSPYSPKAACKWWHPFGILQRTVLKREREINGLMVRRKVLSEMGIRVHSDKPQSLYQHTLVWGLGKSIDEISRILHHYQLLQNRRNYGLISTDWIQAELYVYGVWNQQKELIYFLLHGHRKVVWYVMYVIQ